MAEAMRPRSAARFLFAARMLACALGAGAVLGLCVPSYLWLEPQTSSERVGWACLTLALVAAAAWLGSLRRAAWALAASVRLNRRWQQAGSGTPLPRRSGRAGVVGQKRGPPFGALRGLPPRLVPSG